MLKNFVTLVLVFFFSLCIYSTARSDVSSAIYFPVGGQNVRVKIYSYQLSGKDHVVFKYGDLINRAIKYKNGHPNDVVQIRFASYTFDKKAYIGFRPDTTCYGWVYGNNQCDENTERLIYSLVKAAKNQVKVWFLYQNPPDENGIDPKKGIGAYFGPFMDDFVTNEDVTHYVVVPGADGLNVVVPVTTTLRRTVGDFLKFRRTNWGPESHNRDQQHNKFMLVSHYGNQKHSVYVTTANVDDYSGSKPYDWVQSGTLVNGNVGLYRAYLRYFGKLWTFYDKKPDFEANVREGKNADDLGWPGAPSNHRDATLNYDDGIFSAYFYPMPEDKCGTDAVRKDALDTKYNPVAKLLFMAVDRPSQRKYLKINVYRYDWDDFGKAFNKRLLNVKKDGHMNVKSAIRKHDGDGAFGQFDGKKGNAKTHAKNFTFAFSSGGVREYYSITGSANAKWYAFCSKANNQLVIKETRNTTTTTEHPIYDSFKEIFESAYQ